MNRISKAHGSRVCSAAFFDLDNTLIRGSSLFHLGWGGFKRGMFSKREALKFLFAQLHFRLTRKERAEAPSAWGDFAAAFIKGAEASKIMRIVKEIMEESVRPALRETVLDMARRHLADGEEVWIVTASPHELSHMLAESLGFTGGIGTRAEVVDGYYTGRILAGILHGPLKAKAVATMAEERGIDLARSSAYTDSVHDMPLLRAVGFPRVVAPDQQLARVARRDGWPIHLDRSFQGLFGGVKQRKQGY